MYDCEDCIRRLDQLVDKELSAPEQEEVQIHMQACGDCVKRYAFQDGLKRLVRVSFVADQRAPEALRERLRQQLNS